MAVNDTVWGLVGLGVITLVNSTVSAVTNRRLAKQGVVIDKVHILSNSAMGSQLLSKVELLKALAVFAHRLAETGTEADVAAAKALDVRVIAAQVEYQDHLIKQAKVDAKGE
jgi:hypothetical protein